MAICKYILVAVSKLKTGLKFVKVYGEWSDILMQRKELDIKSIGQRIREERKKFQLSQEKLAEIIGISDYYIGQLERGERQMSLPVMVSMANALHISLDYLIFGDDNLVNIDNIKESKALYTILDTNTTHEEIWQLLQKCSPKELELFKEIIATILPYINKK